MRKIWSIAWTDFQITFSERSTLLFFLILPLVFTAVIGSSLSGITRSEERIPVLVVDQDDSELSAALMTALAATSTLRPIPAAEDEAERRFADEEIPVLIRVPEGFGDALQTGQPVELSVRLASNDTRVLAAERAIRAAARRVESATLIALTSVTEAERVHPFADEAERQAYFRRGLAMARELLQRSPTEVQVIRAAEATDSIPGGFEQASAGQLVTWVLITLLGASDVFVSERLQGTLRRLLTTPTRAATILAGKIVGRLSLGLLQMVLLIGAGAWFFNVRWGRSPSALALVVLAFGLSAVALGVMLGAFARTREQANGLTILFAMLLAALGGAWWPLEITPKAYQAAVQVLPSTWAMRGFVDVIVRGQGVPGVLPEVGMLLAFAALFFTIGIWRLKLT